MLDLTAEADEILAASPYVTEGRLFKKCDPKRASLYTAFSALSFISGASSLRVLKGLLSKGVAIYNVDFLHAKIVMINGEHFSLGSQNLTVRGRRTNIEASFVSGADTSTKEVKEFFARIHKNARPISAQEIAEMEKMIEPWMEKFKKIEQAADGIDQFLEAKRELREKLKKRMRAALEKKRREEQEQAKREAEEQAKRVLAEQAKREAERLAAQDRSERMKRAVLLLNKFVEKAPVPPEARLVASVRRLTNPPKNYFGPDTHTDSLVPVDRNRDFCQLLKAIGVTPMMKYRYLVFDRDTGKLGFVRFNKTQWTFFANGLLPSETVKIANFAWNIEIRFDWDHVKDLARNGSVILYVESLGSAKKIQVASIGFAFSVTGIEMEDLVVESTEKLGHWSKAIKVKSLRNELVKEALESYLLKHLTKQFKFSRNLHGKQAFHFFGQRHPITYLEPVPKRGFFGMVL